MRGNRYGRELHVVERIVVHPDVRQLDHEGALQEPEHQDQVEPKLELEELIEDPGIDREVDGDDPRYTNGAHA